MLNAIKKFLGFAPAPTGELNSRATHTPSIPERIVKVINPLARIEITDEYKKANQLIYENVPLLFVTGKAGTGKSTFIEYLRHSLSRRFAVLAPTGVAALNVRGVTVHSFFGFPPRVLSKEDIRPVQDRKLYKSLDVLILDEVSMIRVDVLDAIDEFLRLNGKNPGQPFGGTQVVMVGDPFQLPPVVASKAEAGILLARYRNFFFFSAKALADQPLEPIELDRVFRQQEDPDFVRILDSIRVGDAREELLRALNDRVIVAPPQGGPIVLTPTNAGADKINISQMNRLPGDGREYVGVITGCDPPAHR